MANVKPFDANTDLFNLDTFMGRYSHFSKILSPFNLFYSNNQFLQFQNNIDEYMSAGKSKFSHKELWDQLYIVKSNLHPETKKPIQLPFRWSCYVFTNIPIIFGLAVLPPTPFNQAIFQSINQANNFGVNVGNSSASNPMSNKEIVTSFTLAVSSALCVSIGFRKVLLNTKSNNHFVKGLL